MINPDECVQRSKFSNPLFDVDSFIPMLKFNRRVCCVDRQLQRETKNAIAIQLRRIQNRERVK